MRRTSAEEIWQELAARIIAGDLARGSALDVTQLAAEFAVSRTSVNEALRKLGASGLIEQKLHAGRALVAKPCAARLRGMFEVMRELEAMCAGRAARNMDVVERQRLDGLHNAMAAIVRQGDAAGYAVANDKFHAIISSGAQNSYLAEVTLATVEQALPFRGAEFESLGRLGRSHAEHTLIVDAILRGDRPAAEATMRSHIASVEGVYQHIMRR